MGKTATILLCAQLILTAACVQFITEIPGLERMCFYEVLGTAFLI